MLLLIVNKIFSVVSFVMDLRTDLTKLFGAKGENSYIALDNTIGSA